MKIHELEYFFSRGLRRLKGSILKSYQNGTLSDRKILRFLALLVLAVSIIQTDPPSSGKQGGLPTATFSHVLSAQSVVPATATPTPFPKRRDESVDPTGILARAALVVDASSSAILYQKEAQLPVPPASTTKMMTALVALEEFSLDEAVTVPSICVLNEGGAEMNLREGERISVKNLLAGLLIASAADSACALSQHGTDGAEGFLSSMNEKAQALNMTQTRYTNVSGLDEANGGNVATAEDILKLTKAALKNPTFRQFVSTVQTNVASVDGDVIHNLVNTNELLTTLPGITGVKTGFTEKAGGCLVFAYEREGREIIGVVLGSSERGRFEDTQRIIDWVFQSFTW